MCFLFKEPFRMPTLFFEINIPWVFTLMMGLLGFPNSYAEIQGLRSQGYFRRTLGSNFTFSLYDTAASTQCWGI